MQNDPAVYIVAAAILSAAIGFIGCSLMVSRRIREAEMEGWKRGVRCRDRDKPRI